MKRPYMKKTVYELADIVAKEFATNPTDKKTVRDVQNELEHRGNVVARTYLKLNQFIAFIAGAVVLLKIVKTIILSGTSTFEKSQVSTWNLNQGM